IPSTTSRLVSVPLASSTVITPSLPTFSIASAMMSPIVVFSQEGGLRSIGFAPAVTFLIPSA
ncbi:MAG TPA: hypothetical protein VN317_00470, partial [Candidatus Methanoperedens sp.]|nr:hypothetical protein [Candidatus Methanoperedens sp.]